jgi:hypothetical protein
MIREKLDEDDNIEILSVDKLPTRWIDFTPEINLDQYEKVHVGNGKDYILRSKTEQDVYMKVSREAFFQSLLQRNPNELLSKARGLLSRMEAELVNTPVGGPSRVKGLPDSIDPNKPPCNHRDAMRREDQQEWAEAYDKEYQGFIEQGTLKIARPEKGAKVLDTTTHADYKVTNRVFDKRKIRLCAATNKSKEFIISLETCMLP